MSKRISLITVFLMITLALSACSSLSTSISNASSVVKATDTANLPVESKLSVGLLSLQGTDLAVTTEQTSTLLPLWKAVTSLSTDSNTSDVEIAALYQQIEETLTQQQIQAIQQLSLSEAELSAMMNQYGIKAAQNASSTTAKPDATNASSQAQSQAAAMAAGGMTGGDVPPDAGGMGAMGGTGQTGNQSQSTTKTASYASKHANDLNILFANTVVKMLQERAAA